jgi:hypothetical protein
VRKGAAYIFEIDPTALQRCSETLTDGVREIGHDGESMALDLLVSFTR